MNSDLVKNKSAYEAKIKEQILQYAETVNMHDLPDTFHFWSHNFLLPKLIEIFDVATVSEFYFKAFTRNKNNTRAYNLISLGSGDCAEEIKVALLLINADIDFSFTCYEISPILAAKAQKDIVANNLSEKMTVLTEDINKIKIENNSVDGVMVHHSLHHFVELENIFEIIFTSLKSDGVFVTMDMIGRNGHLRWPETKEWIDILWKKLDLKYKYHHQLKRLENNFIDWDCSVEGFEGIRAQDILPLLVNKFSFTHFLGMGGLIDVFIDRGFGHNFNTKDEFDKNFIEMVAQLNEQLISLGYIKPTLMFAVMQKSNGSKYCKVHKHWTPEFCLREPNSSPNVVGFKSIFYKWVAKLKLRMLK